MPPDDISFPSETLYWAFLFFFVFFFFFSLPYCFSFLLLLFFLFWAFFSRRCLTTTLLPFLIYMSAFVIIDCHYFATLTGRRHCIEDGLFLSAAYNIISFTSSHIRHFPQSIYFSQRLAQTYGETGITLSSHIEPFLTLLIEQVIAVLKRERRYVIFIRVRWDDESEHASSWAILIWVSSC